MLLKLINPVDRGELPYKWSSSSKFFYMLSRVVSECLTLELAKDANVSFEN